MRCRELELYPLALQAVAGMAEDIERAGEMLERWRRLCGSSAAEVVAREKSLQWWRARMAGTLHYVEAVEAALGSLPPPGASVIIYRVVNGESFSLIGKRYGVAGDTARRKYREAVKAFMLSFPWRLGT